jgi:hypothetical protein
MNLLRQCAIMDAGTSGSLSADVKTDVVVK